MKYGTSIRSPSRVNMNCLVDNAIPYANYRMNNEPPLDTPVPHHQISWFYALD